MNTAKTFQDVSLQKYIIWLLKINDLVNENDCQCPLIPTRKFVESFILYSNVKFRAKTELIYLLINDYILKCLAPDVLIRKVGEN